MKTPWADPRMLCKDVPVERALLLHGLLGVLDRLSHRVVFLYARHISA
jgi:hypothetical protein